MPVHVALNEMGKVPVEQLPGEFLSNPPSGMCKVSNIYINPSTGKLVIVYDDQPV